LKTGSYKHKVFSTDMVREQTSVIK